MTRFWDGQTDGRSHCTPRPAFAFGDAGKNNCKENILQDFVILLYCKHLLSYIYCDLNMFTLRHLDQNVFHLGEMIY